MPNERKAGSRALIKELRDFLTGQSDNRDCIVEYIKNAIGNGEKSIALCFRGSYASLYYRCCQLLKIKLKNKNIVGEFNFRYALAHPDRENIKNQLEQKGVVYGNNERAVWFVLQGDGGVTKDNLSFILGTYIKLIDSFIGRRSRTNSREKDRQQQLFAAKFGKSDNTYFDIEYTEPRETLIKAGYYDYAEDKIAAHKADKGGRFDLLGLRKTDGGYMLQFVELKSTTRACDGKAGVDEHIKDYTKYCKYKTLVEARKSDAVSTVNLLSKILGEKFFPETFTKEDIVGHEIVFIFTDKAVKRVETYSENLKANDIVTVCYDGNLNPIK